MIKFAAAVALLFAIYKLVAILLEDTITKWGEDEYYKDENGDE